MTAGRCRAAGSHRTGAGRSSASMVCSDIRCPIRRLIRILDVRRGGGTYVTGPDPRLLPEAAGSAVGFHRDDTVPEFPAVRRALGEHRAVPGAPRDRDAGAARSWATVRIAGVERWPRSALRPGVDLRVFDHGERGSHPFTPPCKGAASAPAARRKVGGSGEGTSEGGAG